MKINEALKKYELIPNKYTNIGKSSLIDTNKGIYIYKNIKPNVEILNYLKSRNFDYIPNIISNLEEDYRISKYIEDYDIPKEQKILDMVSLVSLLHSKTTHYREISSNDYEQLYDDINNNIDYLYSYYTDLITIIESKVYMSPSEYLLARNITVIYDTLNKCKKQLESWHTLIKNKTKMRTSVIHNNLKLDHFIRNENSYLINWDKTKIANPIFDLYKLYKNHSLDFDFETLLEEYEKNYPLLEEEKQLLFILISMPDIIDFDSSQYNNTKNISRAIDIIYKTNNITKKV